MSPVRPVPSVDPVADRRQRALALLEQLDVSAMKLGLERMERLMMTLGNPQDQLPTIHIAGTNGKGSTAAMLTGILQAAGLKVGTFTSPHLIDVTERIALNGAPIPQDGFADQVLGLQAHLEGLGWDRDQWPTYFEFLNALAWRYFHQEQVDIAVMEVGLGGRLDSTNAVRQPLVCAITSIGWDHMERLGHTLGAIASEKAGILKPGVPTVLGPQLPAEALSAIQARAANVNGDQADTLLIHADAQRLQPVFWEGDALSGGQRLVDTVAGCQWTLPLLGTYQRQNLATVLAVVDQLRQQGWAISPDQVQRGLLQTRWPGRLQYFEARRWLVDGSHNEQGFESLRQSLSRYLPQQVPLYWVVSLRNNRPPEALMETLAQFPRTAGIMWTEPARVPRTPASRAVKPSLYHAPQALAEQCQVSGVFAPSVEIGWAATVDEALIWLTGQTEATEGAIGIVTGSLYTVGEVLAWIREQDEDRMP